MKKLLFLIILAQFCMVKPSENHSRNNGFVRSIFASAIAFGSLGFVYNAHLNNQKALLTKKSKRLFAIKSLTGDLMGAHESDADKERRKKSKKLSSREAKVEYEKVLTQVDENTKKLTGKKNKEKRDKIGKLHAEVIMHLNQDKCLYNECTVRVNKYSDLQLAAQEYYEPFGDKLAIIESRKKMLKFAAAGGTALGIACWLFPSFFRKS